jgi:hypothetical protein
VKAPEEVISPGTGDYHSCSDPSSRSTMAARTKSYVERRRYPGIPMQATVNESLTYIHVGYQLVASNTAYQRDDRGLAGWIEA